MLAALYDDNHRWLRTSPQHAAAWQRVGSLLQQPIADLHRVEAQVAAIAATRC